MKVYDPLFQSACNQQRETDITLVAMTQSAITQTLNLAIQHHMAGRLPEAEQLYRQILATSPRHPDALHYLGVIAHHRGQHDLAVNLIGQALALHPNYASAHENLGNALKDRGMLDEAIVSYRKAIALTPKSAQTHNNLAISLLDSGKFDEAIVTLRRAVKLNPQYADAYSNLSHALMSKSQVDEALITARKAVTLDSKNASGHGNLGNALRDTGQLTQAFDAYRQILFLQPTNPDAHLNYAIALLLGGHLAQGWDEYEWRWESPTYRSMKRDFTQPQWEGSPLTEGKLLLHAEQGLGDAILFSRYLPLVAERVGADAQHRIIFEIHPELERLFQPFAKQCTIVLRGQPLPSFDMQCRLLSLPRIFKTTLETVPAHAPYLFPDSDLIQAWRQKLTGSGTEINVAIAWAGNPAFKADQKRSLSLDRLAPLAAVSDVKFFSVQKGYAEQQLQKPPRGLQLINMSPELHDFADTAAVMSLMDLVITTDTSVAHLAGALGRPTWLMLQSIPYFIWLLDRKDSPWYPTVRLFRQPARGDWNSVIKQVADALGVLVKQKI